MYYDIAVVRSCDFAVSLSRPCPEKFTFAREVGVGQFGRNEPQRRDKVASPSFRAPRGAHGIRESKVGVSRVWPEKCTRASAIYSIESWGV